MIVGRDIYFKDMQGFHIRENKELKYLLVTYDYDGSRSYTKLISNEFVKACIKEFGISQISNGFKRNDLEEDL